MQPFEAATEFDAEAAAVPTQDEINWAILTHVGALAATLITGGTLGPLVPFLMMVTKGESSRFVADHAKATLNFYLTWVIAIFALGTVTCGLALIPAWFVGCVLALVGGIQGGMRANEGKRFTYPATYTMLK